MKFLCLGYYDEKRFDALPKPELDALVRQCQTHDEALRNTGHLVITASLGAPRDTSCIRPKNGVPSVTDGPYAETKEQIGAFFIVEARDLAEATDVASKHPAARLGEHVGWGVEVRPIDYFVQS
jgi:hypothetical protein